jgi:predicted phage tail protein
MKTIRLYGRLARFLGRRVFRAEVASAAEAVRFLVANFPQLETHMAQQQYHVMLDARDLGPDDLHEPAGAAVISLVPVIGGAGTIGRIIGGVALLALSFIPGFAAWAGPTAVTLIGGVGASLALGGVAQLLTPVPRVPTSSKAANSIADNNDPRKNYSFSGIQNVTRQGVPLPVIYGEAIVGSVVASAAIDVDQA